MREVMMKNLTKHEIRLMFGEAMVTIPPSGHVARTTGDNQELADVVTYGDYEVMVYRWTDSNVKELPDPCDNIVYLTSGVVAQIVKRPDVMCPNTSPQSIVRDVYGNKIGVRSLLTYV